MIFNNLRNEIKTWHCRKQSDLCIGYCSFFFLLLTMQSVLPTMSRWVLEYFAVRCIPSRISPLFIYHSILPNSKVMRRFSRMMQFGNVSRWTNWLVWFTGLTIYCLALTIISSFTIGMFVDRNDFHKNYKCFE